MVERFNTSQSDVVVKYEFQGTYEETAQKLTAALPAKQAPDVCAPLRRLVVQVLPEPGPRAARRLHVGQ